MVITEFGTFEIPESWQKLDPPSHIVLVGITPGQQKSHDEALLEVHGRRLDLLNARLDVGLALGLTDETGEAQASTNEEMVADIRRRLAAGYMQEWIAFEWLTSLDAARRYMIERGAGNEFKIVEVATGKEAI